MIYAVLWNVFDLLKCFLAKKFKGWYKLHNVTIYILMFEIEIQMLYILNC